MTKTIHSRTFIVAAIVLLVVGFALGPTVEIDDTLKPVTLPAKTADLDHYLQQQEQQYTDIVPRAEKTIIWADPKRRLRTPVSLVYLHGYAASRQELAPLCDIVARELGANLYYQRLTGHGRDSQAMAEISVNALVNDANEALQIGKRLGEKVILIGGSTGATLATIIAARDSSHSLASLVLISPNFGPKRPESELLLWPWGNVMLQIVEGSTYSFETYNEQHARYWSHKSPSKALLPMMGIVDLARKTDLAQLQTPVLVFYSPQDEVVSTEAIKQHYERFGAAHKNIHPVANSGDPQHHVLAGDILSPQTTKEMADEIIRFVQPLL
jgi:alpha-beta hydrolase superfamily lysophospholipase